MFIPMKGKPEIQYPCAWRYKIFGTNQALMREAVERIITVGDYNLTLSRSSSHSKYHCLNLDIRVMSEEDRIGIYQALMAHQDIILVL
jgi:hypothetical protein